MFEKKYDFLELLLIDCRILVLKKTAVILKAISQQNRSKWTIENKHGSRELPPANHKSQVWADEYVKPLTANCSLTFAVK